MSSSDGFRAFLVLSGALLACNSDEVVMPVTGMLEITTVTTGPEPDPDGYSIRLNSGPVAAIGVVASIQRPNLTPGNHLLLLGGIAPNCSVAGDNPRTVVVSAGETALADFAITCSALAAQPMITFESDLSVLVVNPDGTGRRLLAEGLRPVWSPDRTKIAFIALIASEASLSTINPDGSDQADLVPPVSGIWVVAEPPAWSPDGRTIAFEVFGCEKGTGSCPIDIWLVRADGSGASRLVMNGSSPSWSPDGQKIAFQAPGRFQWPGTGNNEIYVINIDGTGLTRLTDRPDHSDRVPRWSPDGVRILFHTLSLDDASDIAVMNADGTGLVNLGHSTGSGAVWLQGGARIGFISDQYLTVMNSDGTGRTSVTEEVTAFQVAWSPDEGRVALTGVPNTLPGALGELYVLNADGTGLTNVSNSPNTSESAPAW